MDRQTIIVVVDVAVQIAALLIALLCVKNIYSALGNKYVFINGKKATRTAEPVGYWLVMVSWAVVLVVFASVFVSSF
jgi:hypothetical protein